MYNQYNPKKYNLYNPKKYNPYNQKYNLYNPKKYNPYNQNNANNPHNPHHCIQMRANLVCMDSILQKSSCLAQGCFAEDL